MDQTQTKQKIDYGLHRIWSPLPGSQVMFLASRTKAWEALYEGTRGVGKSDALLMDFAQDVGKGWGSAWRGILFRRYERELTELIIKSVRWFKPIYPGAVYMQSGLRWLWPGGETLQFGFVRKKVDYWQYHGFEIPWIGWDELTNWPDLDLYDMMKSVNRSPVVGLPLRIRATANPYGVGHNAVKMRFIDPGPPGSIITVDGKTRTRISGHWSENTVLLRAQPDYPRTITASATSPQQRKAWLHGSWDIMAGGMFDDVWDPDIHIITPFEIPPSWRITRSFDWGSSHPFSVGWWAESDGTTTPDGRIFPRGSLIRVGEWYGWTGERPNVGLGITDYEIAQGITVREYQMGHHARVYPGPSDPQIFHTDPRRPTTAAIFAQHGIRFTRADNRPGSRVQGWQAMRRMFKAALDARPERPGLYVFDTCRQFIRTVPTLARSESNPDDIDANAEDHIADETRYRVMEAQKIRASTFQFRV